MNITEASKLVRLKVSTIYGKVSKKEIPHIKMDKNILFEERALLEWVKSRSQKIRSSSLYEKAEGLKKIKGNP